MCPGRIKSQVSAIILFFKCLAIICASISFAKFCDQMFDTYCLTRPLQGHKSAKISPLGFLKGCIKWAGNTCKNCVLSCYLPFFFLTSFKLFPFLVTFIKFLLIHCLVLYAEDVLNTLIKRKPSVQLQCTVIECCNVHINFSQITFMKEYRAFSTGCKTPFKDFFFKSSHWQFFSAPANELQHQLCEVQQTWAA